MDLNFQRAFELLSESGVNKMEEERIFVVFAKIGDVNKIETETALLTPQQLNLVHWLYDKGFLDGTFDSNDDICIEEP